MLVYAAGMLFAVVKFGALTTTIIIGTTTPPFPIPVWQMIRRVPAVFAGSIRVLKTKKKLLITLNKDLSTPLRGS